MYFDRRISQFLLDELESGGFAWLPRVCRVSPSLDLQLRGYPETGRSHVTAYVGTTKVLDVFERKGRFKVMVGASARRWGGVSLPWDELARSQPPEAFRQYRELLAVHTAQAASSVPSRWSANEGALQTLLAKQTFRDLTIIDREAVIGFSDEVEKQGVRKLLVPRFATVLTQKRVEWLDPNAPDAWDEADFLALDKRGRLVVAEVKRGTDLRLRWAPAQVAFYTALFRRWAEQVGSAAVGALEGMIEQRARLGQVPGDRPAIRSPLEVVAVVITGVPAESEPLRQAQSLATALADDPVLRTGSIEIWKLDPVGVTLSMI